MDKDHQTIREQRLRLPIVRSKIRSSAIVAPLCLVQTDRDSVGFVRVVVVATVVFCTLNVPGYDDTSLATRGGRTAVTAGGRSRSTIFLLVADDGDDSQCCSRCCGGVSGGKSGVLAAILVPVGVAIHGQHTREPWVWIVRLGSAGRWNGDRRSGGPAGRYCC